MIIDTKVRNSKKRLQIYKKAIPQILATVIGIISVFSFIRAISDSFRHHSKWLSLVDNYIFQIQDASIAWSVVLAILAAALSLRKRLAWVVLISYIGIFWLWNLAEYLRLIPAVRDINPQLKVWHGHPFVQTIILLLQTLLLIVVIFSGSEFKTRVRSGNITNTALILILGMSLDVLFGTILIYGTSFKKFHPPLGMIITYLTNRATGISIFNDSNEKIISWDSTRVGFIVGVIGALVYIFTLLVLLRSKRGTNNLTPSDEVVIRRLWNIYGKNDSLAYFATRRDKAVVWAKNARAAVTYRVELGVSLASSDPVGDPASWGSAIAEWKKQCEKFGWQPAVLGATEEGAKAYTEAGLTSWHMGDEAILFTNDFDVAKMNSPEMKILRQAVTRIERAGITYRIRRHKDLSKTELLAVEENADKWRINNEERIGFSMALGRFQDPTDGECVLIEALDTNGVPIGMLSLVPWGPNGLSLDVMRKSRTAPNGTMEFMVVKLLQSANGFGVNRVSLNFAVFREVFQEGNKIGAGPIFKLWFKILLIMSKWWQLETLYRSNVKYNPTWVPRYACFPGPIAIPKTAIAIMIAEGFIQFPWVKKNSDLNTFTGLGSSLPPAALASDFLQDTSLENLKSDYKSTKRSQQQLVRIDKLNQAETLGIDLYPAGGHKILNQQTIDEVLKSKIKTKVNFSGRILRLRDFGSILFADIGDWDNTVQILVELPTYPKLKATLEFIDIGDIVQISGTIGKSKNGTFTVLVHDFKIISKCLRPLPHKWKGLTDPETKVRQRYLDLITNKDARETVILKTKIIKQVRSYFDNQNFVEVETPVLQKVHGGANAAPFNTHINAYNLDLSLRIAPELYLKRLLVGGMEKVYEIGRQFRNEGADATHNPEFTSLEAYWAYADYSDMMELTENFFKSLTNSIPELHGKTLKNIDIDLSKPFKKISVYQSVSERVGFPIDTETSIETLQAIFKTNQVLYNPNWDEGKLVLELYENLIEKNLIEPTFVCDFPASVSPLTREHRQNNNISERWDLVIDGTEIATAYTEQNNPITQREKLYQQSLLAAGGDKEAMEIDEDFLTSLEYSMPPAGGLGIGIDRLIMLLTGKNIRETLLFPLNR